MAEESKLIDAGRLKHLEMIQAVISRMASNSFLVKGWSLTLFAAILVAGAKESPSIIWIAAVPVAAFWMKDGFFLRQERLFRALYDKVRLEPQNQPTDFSMDTRVVRDKVGSWLQVMFTPTLLLFHIPLLIVLAVAYFILQCGSCACH